MFETMLAEIDAETIRILFSLKISTEAELENLNNQEKSQELKMEKEEINPEIIQKENKSTPESNTGTVKRNEPKLGRNDQCLCGSGKKFKHCHGK